MKLYFQKIKDLLERNRFLKGVTVLAGSTAIGQGIVIAATPFLTRIYSPLDFGILAVYASFLGIFINVWALNYEYAILLSDDDRKAINLLALSVIIILLNSLFATVAIFFVGDCIDKINRFQVLRPYRWLLPIGLLGGGLYNVFSFCALKSRNYTVIGKTKLHQSAGMVMIQLILGLFRFGSIGLLAGHLFGQIAGIRSLSKHIIQIFGQIIDRIDRKFIQVLAKRYSHFPLYQTPALLLNNLGLQLPSLLLAMFYEPRVAGLFFLTEKVLAGPIMLIGASVSQVFLGEVSFLLKNNPLKVQTLFKKITFKMFQIATPFFIIILFGGKWIFQIAFGDEWSESGTFVQVMAFVFLFKFTADSVINFAIIERQDLSFYWALLRVCTVLAGMIIPARMNMPAIMAVVGYSIAMTFSYVAKYFLWSYAINKSVKHRLGKFSI